MRGIWQSNLALKGRAFEHNFGPPAGNLKELICKSPNARGAGGGVEISNHWVHHFGLLFKRLGKTEKWIISRNSCFVTCFWFVCVIVCVFLFWCLHTESLISSIFGFAYIYRYSREISGAVHVIPRGTPLSVALTGTCGPVGYGFQKVWSWTGYRFHQVLS